MFYTNRLCNTSREYIVMISSKLKLILDPVHTYKLYIYHVKEGAALNLSCSALIFFFYSVSIVHIYIYLNPFLHVIFFCNKSNPRCTKRRIIIYPPPPHTHTHTLVFGGIFLNQSSNLLKSGPWNQNKPKFHWKASWEKTWCIVKVFGNLAHQLAIFCSYV